MCIRDRYLLMYYSAILHLAVALFLIIIWRKKLGFQRVKVLLEILVISGGGVIIQLLNPFLLTTGFGVSLGILALFITINNPYANMDSLTGLYNHCLLYTSSFSFTVVSQWKMASVYCFLS